MASVVTELPDTLSPWSAWLKWFAPELAAELGPMLQRLQPLLSPFKTQTQGGEHDWDGLDDLRTRGSYERLLASEWLLADELPDEFLRRAASGEHMFLTPKPRQKRSQRTIVALFDAGPLQLGAPRLAHIAMWILLARRAVQVQGEMRWGVLQSPGELNDAHDVQNLKALLARRTFTPANETHLEQWRAAFDQLPSPSGERWFIGSPYGEVSARAFTHRVHLHKDLKINALDVSLQERGVNRKVSLLLPKQEPALTLLRGSFEPVLAEQYNANDAHAIALQRPPVICIDGTRVGVVHRDIPAITSFYIPSSPGEVSRKPRQSRWSYGYSALSATLIGKNLGVLMADPQQLRFWPTSMIQKPCPPQEEFHAPGSTAAWLPAAWLRSSKAYRVCVIDHSQRMLRWDAAVLESRNRSAQPQLEQDAGSSRLQPVAFNVLALAQLNNELAAYVRYYNGRVWFARIKAEGDPEDSKVICEASPDPVVHIGRGCFIAVKLNASTWRLWNWNDNNQGYEARVRDDVRVIGVVRDKQSRVGLLSLADQHLRLHCHDGTSTLLYTAPAKVVSHSVCPNSGIVALVTIDRQLIAFSAATQELRLCVQTGRDKHAAD